MNERKPNSSRGFVQIFVITALIAIAGVLTLLLALSNRGVRAGVSLERTILADAIANSAFARRAEAFRAGQGDFEPSEATISSERISTAVENDGGRISVLATPMEIVESYLGRAGLDATARQGLLDDLKVFRDDADGQSALAALELGLGPSLPQGQFQSDFTAQVGTVTTIDPMQASETTLAAIPDLTDIERAEIIAARTRGEQPPLGLSAYLGNPSTLYALVVTVHWSDAERSTRRIPFELTGSGWLRQLGAAGP